METKKLDLKFQIQSAWKKIESTKSHELFGSFCRANLMAVEGVSIKRRSTRTTLEILDAEKVNPI